MLQWLTRNAHAMLVHVGEIRQAHLARHMDLAKDHLLFGTVLRTPCPYPPLQRATDACTQVGYRRRSSSKIATGRRPGEDFSSGSTSVSKISESGSGRRLPRGAFFWDSRIGSACRR